MLLQDFVNKLLKKNISEGILGKIDKKRLAVWGVGGVWVNPLKKENLRKKPSSGNVE